VPSSRLPGTTSRAWKWTRTASTSACEVTGATGRFARPPSWTCRRITATDDGQGPYLPFDLSIKNYDDLRESSRHVPLILVVVCVPPALGDWLEETPEHTAMRRCAYWFSVRGQPPTLNTTTCRVQLPRSQRFTVDAVREIMNRLGEGGAP